MNSNVEDMVSNCSIGTGNHLYHQYLLLYWFILINAR